MGMSVRLYTFYISVLLLIFIFLGSQNKPWLKISLKQMRPADCYSLNFLQNHLCPLLAHFICNVNVFLWICSVDV
ncbi:hypothetical protein BY996DRAFT_6700693, partial [Phakopsora pachyrhizi]